VAIGVPLASVGARLVGSLGFVMSAKRYAMVDEARTAAMLREAGQQIEQRIERSVAAPIS
jgi:DNA-binding IclR family transcriptional regulator